MSDFLKMDIFFYVTTISVIVLTILLIVLMVFIIKISKDISYISKKARGEADLIAQDLSELRENIKNKGAKLKYFMSFFSNLYKKKK